MGTKRQDIVESADRLFYREGFADVGIDRLVDDADVALGTLYRHFRSRSEVVVAAMAHRHDAFLQALTGTPPAATGAAAVLHLFDALAAWSSAEGGNGCFFLRAAADYPADAGIRAAALAHKRAYLALVERLLCQGGWDRERAAGLAPRIFILLEGAVAAAFTLGDRAAVADARSIAAAILAAGGPTP